MFGELLLDALRIITRCKDCGSFDIEAIDIYLKGCLLKD